MDLLYSTNAMYLSLKLFSSKRRGLEREGEGKQTIEE
jgi:hypothetical protein